MGVSTPGDPAADCAKPTVSLELLVKPTFWASWRPRRPQDGPPGAQDSLPGLPGAQDGLQTQASWRPRRLPDGPKSASGRASCRPRRPPTGHHLPISSPADKITCRQVHLPHKSALVPNELSIPALFCRSRRTAVTACLTRQPPDELSCMSTLLHANLLPSHYATGSH